MAGRAGMASRRLTPLRLIACLAVCLLEPLQLLHTILAAAQAGGCGRDFLSSLPEYLLISGNPLLPSVPLDEIQDSIKACKERDGSLASVQLDFIRYSKRGLTDTKDAKVRTVYQDLLDYYSQKLSNKELVELAAGVALCLPQSCARYSNPDELSHAVILYFACMANGRCQDAETVGEPLWKDEINVTFVDKTGTPTPRPASTAAAPKNPAPQRSALKAPRTKTDVAVTVDAGGSLLMDNAPGVAKASGKKKAKGSGCGKDFLHQLRFLVPVSGMPYEEPGSKGALSEGFLQNVKSCAALESRHAKVQFDIMGYIKRGLVEQGPETREVLGRLHDFYEGSFDVAELEQVNAGIALCLPKSCDEESTEDLSRVSILYFVCMAGATCQGAELVSEPLWSKEINVTFPAAGYMLTGSVFSDTVSAEPQASKKAKEFSPTGSADAQVVIPKGDFGKRLGARPLGAGHKEGLPSMKRRKGRDRNTDGESVAPGLGALSACCGGPRDGGEGDYLGILRGTGFRAPWWMSGYDLEGWELWSWMARKGLRRRRDRRKVTLEAERIIKQYSRFAAKWIQDINDLQRRGTCKLHYMVFQSDTMEEESFHLLQYAFAPRQDMRWRAMPEWADHWGTFCPMGFTAALIARGFAAKEAGLLSAAKDDFTTAKDMLGGCSELDLMDRKLWGMTSGDLDKELLKMHLVEERNAEGSGGPRKARVWMSHGEAEKEVREVQWHALHLNSLVRLHLHDAAERKLAIQGPPKLPKLVMFASPPHLSVMWIPMLEHIYGDDLSLALLYLGLWEAHEKCKTCMESYKTKYVVEDPTLASVPYNSSRSFKTGAGGIIWGEDYTVSDFEESIKELFQKNYHIKEADVFLCNAPEWMCVVIQLVGKMPTISLSLFSPTLGAPESLTEEHVKKWQYKLNPLQHGEEFGDTIKSIVVVDEPMRSYNTIWNRNFYPFVSLLSMYISERYECRGDVLVMREGSYGRFSVTLRGRVFFAALAQFVTDSSPFRFRQLPYSSMRLSYKELSHHRAAIFVPLMPGTKVTFKDLLTMEMPIFMPSMELQGSISAQWTCVAQQESNQPPWVITQCRTEEKEPWLRLSGFMRHPHVQHFESLTDLVSKLAAMDCTDLTDLSKKIGKWNQALISDDANFWRTAINALGQKQRPTPTPTAKPTAGSESIAAAVRQAAAWPRPNMRIPNVEDAKECTAPEAEYCKRHRRGDSWTLACCANVHLLHERHPFLAQGDPPKNTPAEGKCLWRESECDEKVILYATHLLKQDLPPI